MSGRIWEDTSWGRWEIKTDEPEGKPWLRDIDIVHVHDYDEYPVLSLICAGEDFAPALAERIVWLNNEAPKVIRDLYALLEETLGHVDEWNFPVDLRGRIEAALKNARGDA